MKEQKIKANAVGATIGRPHFEEKAKEQKGITLIALIITIIVMLILVGVTVATISDGGLFQKAKTAAEKTEEKTIYEQLVGIMKIGADGKIDVKGTAEAALNLQGKTVTLKSPSTVDEITNSATIEVTSKNGKIYEYTIIPEKIISGELKFYGYGYYFADADEEVDIYWYFLENGLGYLYGNDNLVHIDKYEKNGNEINAFGSVYILSSDHSYMTDYYDGDIITRDDNKTYKFDGIQDETYNIYINAAYFSDSTKGFISIMKREGEEQCSVLGIISEDESIEGIGISEFIESGAVVSADGKQVVYNGVTYKLVERIK